MMFVFHYRFVRKVLFLVLFIVLTHSVIYLLCKREDHLKNSNLNPKREIEEMVLKGRFKTPDDPGNPSNSNTDMYPSKKNDSKTANDFLKDMVLIKHRQKESGYQNRSQLGNYAVDSRGKIMNVNGGRGKGNVFELRPIKNPSHRGLLKSDKLDIEWNKRDAFDMGQGDDAVEKRLQEMGGVLIKRQSPEDYAEVILPPFVDSRDRHGLGAMGEAVHIDVAKLTLKDKMAYEKGWKTNSFNQLLSDRISIHRPLPDRRSTTCNQEVELQDKTLPSVSVIIIFHNEAWSALLRSVSSVLSRSPEDMLREIILVDDFSTLSHLRAPLEKYYSNQDKVKIVRATRRQGLTRARLLGFQVSSAPIVVFLDSHVECFPGWLDPLLQRIANDSTTVVFPDIGIINDETLGVEMGTVVQNRGGFNWHLSFVWDSFRQDPRHPRSNNWLPIRSPTMPGGLFAISRSFFIQLGTYDAGIDHWGGENLELSFKAWMCGGSVELVPCSQVGHIFRRSSPIKWTKYIGRKNLIRVAEVWMDDYKNYFYEEIRYKLDECGDVSRRKELREKLGCHNFDWYLRNVYPEKIVPSRKTHVGNVQLNATTKCLTQKTRQGMLFNTVSLVSCIDSAKQFWTLGIEGSLTSSEMLLCSENGVLRTKRKCHQTGSQWSYSQNGELMLKDTKLCLTAENDRTTLSIKPCTNNEFQRWDMHPRRKDLNFPSPS